MGVGKATRPATDHLLEGSADWVCGNCYDEATELHAKRQTEAKVRAKQDHKDCCTSAECTVAVEALDGSGYDRDDRGRSDNRAGSSKARRCRPVYR